MAHPDDIDLKPYWNKARGLYYVRVWIDGQRYRKSLFVDAEADVPAALDLFRADVLPTLMEEHRRAALERISPKRDTIATLVDWYLTVRLPYLNRALSTRTRYQRTLKGFREFCETHAVTNPKDIRPALIEEWQLWEHESEHRRTRSKPHAPIANRDELKTLKRFVRDAVRIREAPIKPFEWELPSERRGRFRALTNDELSAFCAVVQEYAPDLWPVVQWIIHTGWRKGDVLDFRLSEDKGDWIDREALKTQSRLPWPVTPTLRRLIDTARAKLPTDEPAAARIFRDANGAPFTNDTFDARYRWIMKQAIKDERISFAVTMRDLRKTFATAQARRGVSPRVLQELLGDKTLEVVLQHYEDVDLERMGAALAGYEESLEPINAAATPTNVVDLPPKPQRPTIKTVKRPQAAKTKRVQGNPVDDQFE